MAGGLAGLSALPRHAWSGDSRPRLAIVGGGMGGVATAYRCDPRWRVELFEARDKLGGHADTVRVDLGGRELHVDLGAEFFHPRTHPRYVALLRELGLYDDQALEAKAGLTIFPAGGEKPYFCSARPFSNLIRAVDFVRSARAARKLVSGGGSYELTVEEWVDGLGVSARSRSASCTRGSRR